MNKLPFKIKQIKPRIFLFEFTDQYNMNMHFLRYQEFYESPNPKFRNKSFTILEFMEWQAKTEGSGNFTYPTAWSGFNLPSHIVFNCFKLFLLKGNKQTLLHEISHGMFYLNSEYKKEVTKLVKALPIKVKSVMERMLKNSGYTKQVFVDEINAYFSTSTKEQLSKRGIKIKTEDKPFKELFNKYNAL